MAEKKTFDNVPEADVVVKYINARFRAGKGTNMFIIGLSGTGKSSSSQRIGELIIESRPKEFLNLFLVDSLLKLIEAIRASKPGDIIVIEEVSVLFPSRRAMGRENVGIGKIFDTIRKKKLCLVSNCPLWHSVDKHMRSMGDVLIQTLNILKTQGVVISKFWRLQTDPSSGKTYLHTMTRKGIDVKLMITRMPNIDRWNAYEKDKDQFMEELYQELQEQQIKKKNNGKGKSQMVKEEIRTIILENIDKKTAYLHKITGLSDRSIQRIRKEIKEEQKTQKNGLFATK